MKTKYLFGAFAALMFAACSQDELVSVKQDGITYSVTAATQTRAADSYCNTALPGSFKVWARTDDGKLYINGDKIVNNNNVWTDEDGTRYWPDNNTLDFYAQVNGDGVFKLNDGAPLFENFTVKDNVKDQVDLIYSVRKNQSKPSDGKVVLNFRHALSQVCFRARNNMKNMQVEVKGVHVGHLANTGTFAFPNEDTDKNYEHHDDVADNTTTLNGGTWTIAKDALYNNKYSVTPIGSSVVLAADSKETKNLTCPAEKHVNGFEQVLTLLPQTVAAWNPEEKGADFNGAYFLVDVVLSNIVKDDAGNDVATVVYEGQAAIPVSVAWKQGYRYIYTFVFEEGGDGGWTPTPDDPKPVLTSVKYDVTVDDFIPVEEDKNMDTGKKEEEPTETNYALTFDANGSHFGDIFSDATEFATDTTLTAVSKEASYQFDVIRTTYALANSYKEFGYDLIGWAWAADATTADYVYGDKVTLTKDAPVKTLYAVWTKKDDPSNPGDTEHWGGDNEDPSYEDSGKGYTRVADAGGWTTNIISIADQGGFCTPITYSSNGIQNNLLTSKGSTAYFFQWGRWLGFPTTCANTHFNDGGSKSGQYPVKSQYLTGVNIYDTKLGYVFDSGLVVSYGTCWMGNNDWTPERANNCSIVFGKVYSAGTDNLDYVGANEECKWEDRSGNPCPDGYRLPTASELQALIPTSGKVEGSCAEIKEINGVKYAMQWKVLKNGEIPYVEIKSVKTSASSVAVDDPAFEAIKAIKLYAYGYMNNYAQLSGRNSVGLYWSSESGTNEVEGTKGLGGKSLLVEFTGSTAEMVIYVAPRSFAGNILPIKDASAKATPLTPWLPLSGI